MPAYRTKPSKPKLHWTNDGGIGREQPAIRDALAVMRPDEIDMHFQPIVDLATGRAFAQEALVRCKRPGFENPTVLFDRAVVEEATGRLGRTIREVTFARCGGQTVFVNIHPLELSARWLVRPDDPMNFHDRPVYLEITESAAFAYYDLCVRVLREIGERSGARLVVDDLGAGHSNLRRVLDLEPSVVKLDLSLVRGIEKSSRQRIFVQSIVRMCSDLGARVVAEGIETAAELDVVREIGAHFGQGYFLARPAWPIPQVSWPY